MFTGLPGIYAADVKSFSSACTCNTETFMSWTRSPLDKDSWKKLLALIVTKKDLLCYTDALLSHNSKELSSKEGRIPSTACPLNLTLALCL